MHIVLLLLWYISRGLSSSKGLIGGLSSVVQKKQDNRKERKTKRKKKVKKKEKKKLEGKPRRKSQNRQEKGKTDAPVQDWKLKTQRKFICFVERVKKRPEGRNTTTLMKTWNKCVCEGGLSHGKLAVDISGQQLPRTRDSRTQISRLFFSTVIGVFSTVIGVFSTVIGVVHITSSYPKSNGSHFDLPHSSIHRMTGWVGELWRMHTAPTGPIAEISYPTILGIIILYSATATKSTIFDEVFHRNRFFDQTHFYMWNDSLIWLRKKQIFLLGAQLRIEKITQREVMSQECLTPETWITADVDGDIAIVHEAASEPRQVRPPAFALPVRCASSWNSTRSRGHAIKTIKLIATASDSEEGG